MQSIIGDYLGQAKLGPSQMHLNLTLFPLLSDYAAKTAYVTLDEGLEGGLVEVMEVHEDGSVPRLRLKNLGEHEVLLLDGEELVGARQNRMLNTTILVAARTETDVPVSCVEAGRWAYRTSRFASGRRMAYATLRAQKNSQVRESLRVGRSFDGDQSAIWDEIGGRRHRSGANAPTGAMSDVYTHEAASLGAYVACFRALEGQVGAVFAVDGRVVGVECFGRAETCAKVLPKLVESYAMDAIDKGGRTVAREVTAAAAKRFLSATAKARVETRPSVALGTDARIESKGIEGLALFHGAELLHLSAFKKPRARKEQAA